MSTESSGVNNSEAPIGLICELLSNPEATVITSTKPSFGWVVSDRRRGAAQTAYRIVVGSSKAAVTELNADLWDSGKVKSAESVNVPFGGKVLPVDSVCWWAVQTWDTQDQPSPWSKPQQLNIGKPEDAFYSDQWTSHTINGATTSVHANRHPLEVHTLARKKIISKAPGHYFVDFGKAAFGTLSLTLTSKDARDIEIRLGEKLGVDNTVETQPGGNVLYISQTLPIKPGTHTYKLELPIHPLGIKMPEHIGEVRPFRYCEIINSPCEINDNNLLQLAVFYRFDESASSFTCSDPVLNDVWEMCKYSIKATSFLGVYVDGQRERLPYEADAYINQLGHYSVDREFALARYSHEHLILHPTWPTEWILFSVLIAWADYMYTGNLDSIKRSYKDLVAKTLIPLEREDGLISTHTGLMTAEVLKSVHHPGDLREIIDWPQHSETDSYVFGPISTVVNAFHYRALVLMGDMAELVGHSDDAKMFRERSERVYSSFNEKLFDSKKGIYRDGEDVEHSSLHANMFPLVMGLVDEKRKPAIVKFIKSRGMACSVYGAQFLLEALYQEDEDEAALKLMANESERSWPHMIYDLGSTVSLEAWDPKFKPNLDWNHAWGAAPANIIPRLLVGVEPLEPGFRVARIKPRIGSLNDVSTIVPTIRGTICVSIKRDEAEYRLRCTIPANMTAEIHLPAPGPSQVMEGNQPAGSAQGVSYIGKSGGRVVYSVQSGSYEFSVRQPSL